MPSKTPDVDCTAYLSYNCTYVKEWIVDTSVMLALRPEKPSRSPLDVGCVDVIVSRDELMDMLRDIRERA